MEKTLFEQMGGTYTKVSDYYLPALALPAEKEKHIGVWGQRHAVFEYPALLVIRLIAAIFVICLSVPGIVYKLISNETVIERMRSFDN